MKIVSKFRDYYDSGMGYGMDNSRIFMREESTIAGSLPITYKKRTALDDVFGVCPNINLGNSQDSFSAYISSFGIVFAGKFYPGVEVKKHYLDEANQFYSLESLLRHVEKVGLVDMIKKKESSWEKTTPLDDLKLLFNLSGSDLVRDWAIQNKIAIVTDWTVHLPHRPNKCLMLNPNLKNLQFQKLFDPITAYQELDMWICGVLTEPDLPNPVPDIQKVANHGFDVKTSFRKPKQK